jgi:protein gp37
MPKPATSASPAAAIGVPATAAGPQPPVHWVIVGGESGHDARPMAAAWVRALRDQCAAGDVPFFFKQWGCHDEAGRRCTNKEGGRQLDGCTHDGWPRGFEPLAAAA